MCNARFPHHEVAGMFWRWGVGLRRTAALYVNLPFPPWHDGRYANRWAYHTLVYLLYLLVLYGEGKCTATHSTLTHSLGSTRFLTYKYCASQWRTIVQGFHGKGANGEALGCAVLSDGYTMYSYVHTLWTMQCNIPYVPTA